MLTVALKRERHIPEGFVISASVKEGETLAEKIDKVDLLISLGNPNAKTEEPIESTGDEPAQEEEETENTTSSETDENSQVENG